MDYNKNKSLEPIKYLNSNGELCIEEWRDVVNYEELYKVSNLGRLMSLGRKRVLWHEGSYIGKPRILNPSKREGYLIQVVVKNNRKKTLSVNRAVAMAFIPNPENKPEVNHDNGIRTDNREVNLIWSTKSENIRHSYDVLKRKGSNQKYIRYKNVTQINDKGEIMATFCSLYDAQKNTSICRHHISLVIRGKRKTAGGYIWA